MDVHPDWSLVTSIILIILALGIWLRSLSAIVFLVILKDEANRSQFHWVAEVFAKN
jgi:hypothetical protein